MEKIYYIYLNGNQQGPLSLQEIHSIIHRNNIDSQTLVWKVGMESWSPAISFSELSDCFAPPISNSLSAPPPIPPQQYEEEPKLFIKCMNCGEVYHVNIDDYSENDVAYSCNKCGSEIGVRFFGYCSNCDVHIGFVDNPNESMLGALVKGAFQGFLNPESTIRGFKRFIDDIPDARTYGICPNCGTKYLECPNCREAVRVAPDADIRSDVFVCPNCKTRTRHP